jgi:glycine/D-amino acid oxidase-like deaminating enzyme/nitrite reductase/ring-hydroxylating ferredoxin subunit
MGSAYYDAHSLWQRIDKPLFTALNSDIQADTCVIGAGIAGLSVAYELLLAGQSVAVLDRERLGLGETGLTSAHLSNALDDGYKAIQHLHGQGGARLAAESHTMAIDRIERIQSNEGIECEFKRLPGYLFLSPDRTLKDLTDELEAARSAGLKEVVLQSGAGGDLFETGPCLVFPRQAQIHPIRYLDGLADAVVRLGGRIFTHSEAVEIRGGPSAFVKTSQGLKVSCGAIVMATNVPINNWFSIHNKNAAFRSYVIGVLAPLGRVEPALFWDMAHPYHYLRFVTDPANGEDILLIGGEDHRTGHDSDPELHFSNLHAWARDRLGLDTRLVTRWSGQILEPVDGLAYIGRNPGDEENVFIATGDSGHGLTHGMIAGLLLRDLILNRENPWSTLYDPSRLHFRSLPAFMKDLAQSTVPYSDWLSTGDVRTVHEIEPGEGAILREGLRKIAVYKDDMGRLYSCSAVCKHLGGIVRWNSAEKTWDCPCHGSRYDRFGTVVNGPAVTDLDQVPSPELPDKMAFGARDGLTP